MLNFLGWTFTPTLPVVKVRFRHTLPQPHARLFVLSAFLSLGALNATSQENYLAEKDLRTTIVGHSLRGDAWMEFYAPDGAIRGKTKVFGVRTYSGRWTILADRVCYDYEGTTYDTCSRLQFRDGRVYHYNLNGNLKQDGVAIRLPGDRIESF